VATPMRAKVLTLDTKTNQILTITAEFGPVPPAPPPASNATPAAGGPPAAAPPWMRGPRPPMIPHSFQILVIGK
jgi:hypothetical protein